MHSTLIQTFIPADSYPVADATPYFLSRIPAGFPSPADDYLEDGLDLNTYLIRRKASTFMFGVTGDSMIGAGILDGDKVVVDRSITAQHGHIVVAVVASEYTLKYLVKISGSIELHAANPKFKPAKFNEASDLQIWGVVIGVVRRYSARG